MEDLTGRIFGKLTVLELAEWKNGTSYFGIAAVSVEMKQ